MRRGKLKKREETNKRRKKYVSKKKDCQERKKKRTSLRQKANKGVAKVRRKSKSQHSFHKQSNNLQVDPASKHICESSLTEKVRTKKKEKKKKKKEKKKKERKVVTKEKS